MQLTETEKSILDYFEKNLPLSVHTHLNDLSSALYTSNATIVRFCQKLGLNGYNEFKYQLRHELKQMKEPVFSPNDLISHSLALFRDNMEAVDADKLKRIADYLTGDNPVYIYGSNLSSVPAKYLQVVLNTLDHPSIPPTEILSAIFRFLNVPKKEELPLFSLPVKKTVLCFL